MSYFMLVNRSRAEVVGGYHATNAGEIQTGVLVMASTTKALTLPTTSQKPDGFAEGLRQHVYAPTALTLDAGEYASVISGHVMVRADADFFYGGTLPSANDTIYVGANGLMATSGTVKLGKCIKAGDNEDYRSAPGVSTKVVMLDLTLGGLETV